MQDKVLIIIVWYVVSLFIQLILKQRLLINIKCTGSLRLLSHYSNKGDSDIVFQMSVCALCASAEFGLVELSETPRRLPSHWTGMQQKHTFLKKDLFMYLFEKRSDREKGGRRSSKPLFTLQMVTITKSLEFHLSLLCGWQDPKYFPPAYQQGTGLKWNTQDQNQCSYSVPVLQATEPTGLKCWLCGVRA